MKSVHPLVRSHAFRVHVYPRARGEIPASFRLHVRPSVLSSAPLPPPVRGGTAAPLANIRAVTTRRNHTALRARARAQWGDRSRPEHRYSRLHGRSLRKSTWFCPNGFPFRCEKWRVRAAVSAPTHFYASDHACDFPRDSRARARTCSRTWPRLYIFPVPPLRINIRIFFGVQVCVSVDNF